MLIDLVDSLRCVASHEETWLVTAVDVMEGRYVVRGTLGCHVCGATYSVDGGIACFERSAPRSVASVPDPVDDEVLRMRALLNLTDGSGIVALGGDAGRWLAALERTSEATFVQVNPTEQCANGLGTNTVVCASRAPFAPRSLRAVYWAGELPGAALLTSLVDALRPGGRFVAPAACHLPALLTELARDDEEWVAQRNADQTSPIALRRSTSPL